MNNPFETLESRLSNIENILLDLKQQKESQEPSHSSNSPITIKRVTEITNLAKQTIYGLVSARKIPHFKKHKKLYFFEDQILEWIKGGKRKTIEEIQGEAKTLKQK